MPKYNIATIAAVCYAAAAAHDQDGQVADDRIADDCTPLATFLSLDAPTRERWETRVLLEIHDNDHRREDQAGGTPDEQRRARLFKAIVKALTVRI